MRWAADAQLKAAQERRAENEAVLAAAQEEASMLALQLEVEKAKAATAKAEAAKAASLAEEASRLAAASATSLQRAVAEQEKAAVEAKVNCGGPHNCIMHRAWCIIFRHVCTTRLMDCIQQHPLPSTCTTATTLAVCVPLSPPPISWCCVLCGRTRCGSRSVRRLSSVPRRQPTL